jgi:hypothetical protein
MTSKKPLSYRMRALNFRWSGTGPVPLRENSDDQFHPGDAGLTMASVTGCSRSRKRLHGCGRGTPHPGGIGSRLNPARLKRR